MLREEFLLPLGLSPAEFAERIRVPAPVVERLSEAKGGITPDLALRLAGALGTCAEFWLNGQLAWDLYHAMRAPAAAEIDHIVPLPSAVPEDV